MADLSPWQRGALDVLHGRPSYITAYRGWVRTGCEGLVKKGLAERVPPVHGCFRITHAGEAEWQRRHPEARNAA